MKYILIFILSTSFLFSQEGEFKDIAVNETFLPLITKNDSLLSIDYLKSDIEFILNRNRLSSSEYSLAIYSLHNDRFIYDNNSDRALTPASITKLFTTFSSLSELGKNHFIKTRIYTMDHKFSDNSIDSDVYLVGGGDALFDKNDLDTLVKLIRSRNLTEINGNVYIDQSFFDGHFDRKEYSGDLDRVQNLGPITPFSISRTTSLRSAKYIRQVLESNNIKLNGKIDKCSIDDIDHDEFSLLAEFRRPLLDMIKITNKRSDNYVAEHLFKINGASNNFAESDYFSSQELLFRKADSLNIPLDNCELNDGSGLSRRNRLSAKAVVKLLATVHKSEFSNEYKSTLSIAGQDGTLKGRMIGTLAEKNCFGKTGTLRDASGLAGYIRTLDGENLAFAFIFNGNRGIRFYKQIEDELVLNMAGFFYFNVSN